MNYTTGIIDLTDNGRGAEFNIDFILDGEYPAPKRKFPPKFVMFQKRLLPDKREGEETDGDLEFRRYFPELFRMWTLPKNRNKRRRERYFDVVFKHFDGEEEIKETRLSMADAVWKFNALLEDLESKSGAVQPAPTWACVYTADVELIEAGCPFIVAALYIAER